MLDSILDKSVVGYTTLGYRCRSHSRIDTDWGGRVAIVTGATSGLGRDTPAERQALWAQWTELGGWSGTLGGLAEASLPASMVKPAKHGTVRRRLITTSIDALGWLSLTLLSLLWLALGLLVGLARRRSFILVRLLVFAWFYFGLALIALVLIAWTFATRASGEPRLRSLYRLQAWWANASLMVAAKLLRMRFMVDGADCAIPGPTVLLIRHASILDTLLPRVFVQRPHGLRVRDVLKQELLFDPCIDIVGNALPSYFADGSGDTDRELERIRALVENLGSDGVLMFPEGTRFSLKKREKPLEGSMCLPRSETS